MSNPTELPDLDLDELETLCKNAPDMWYGTLQIADGVTDDNAALLIEACSPDTVDELVRLARRAQPEGEAPQAELRCAKCDVDRLREPCGDIQNCGSLGTAPAAQHAESGAPSHETIVREGGDLVCTACGTNAPGTPEAPSRDDVLEEAALACEAWGNEKVAKWADDPEMSEDAKARAWDGVQCACAIRKLKPRAAQLGGGQGDGA